MLTAIFRRCLNPIGTAYIHAKEGRLASLFRRREASYSIAKQAVREIGTMYPPPPLERSPKWCPLAPLFVPAGMGRYAA